MQPPKITDYKTYLVAANPSLPSETYDDYVDLLNSRIGELSTVTFDTKATKRDKKDPFSFVLLNQKILVILSGKIFPTGFLGAKITKFNFAFFYDTNIPLVIHTRRRIKSDSPAVVTPEWVNILITHKPTIPEIIHLRGKYFYTNSKNIHKRGLVYEHYPLGDLFKLVSQHIDNRRRIDPEVAKGHIYSLLNAFKDLHAQNILHRDIKLENIFLKSIRGVIGIKIGDWEFACDLNKTTITSIQGTPANCPPEFEHDIYGLFNDVWSLGIVCHILYYTSPPSFWNTLSQDRSCKTQIKIKGWEEFNAKLAKFHSTKPPADDLFATLIWKMLDPDYQTRIQLKDIDLETLK